MTYKGRLLMNEQEKTPEVLQGLAALGEQSGALDLTDEVSHLPQRIQRYEDAHKRSLLMLDYLRAFECDSLTGRNASARLADCGNYLAFREYYTVGKVRLHAAQFCKQHLICPLCAIRRGSKTLQAYMDKYQHLTESGAADGLRLYMITFTVKNGEDLAEREQHLQASLRRLMTRRRLTLSGSRGAKYTELVKAAGGVYTVEVTNRGNGWHPHVHMLALCSSRPSEAALQEEWLEVTGDSFVVDVTEGYGDPVESFMEVFKYAVKFSDLSPAQNWHAAQLLKGRRLINPFGCLWGVKVPESLLDEPLDDLPYFERFYRFVNGCYTLTGECLSPGAASAARC